MCLPHVVHDVRHDVSRLEAVRDDPAATSAAGNCRGEFSLLTGEDRRFPRRGMSKLRAAPCPRACVPRTAATDPSGMILKSEKRRAPSRSVWEKWYFFLSSCYSSQYSDFFKYIVTELWRLHLDPIKVRAPLEISSTCSPRAAWSAKRFSLSPSRDTTYIFNIVYSCD